MSFCFSFPDEAGELPYVSQDCGETLKTTIMVEFVKSIEPLNNGATDKGKENENTNKNANIKPCFSCNKPISIAIVYKIHIGNSFYCKDSTTITESTCARCFLKQAQDGLIEFENVDNEC